MCKHSHKIIRRSDPLATITFIYLLFRFVQEEVRMTHPHWLARPGMKTPYGWEIPAGKRKMYVKILNNEQREKRFWSEINMDVVGETEVIDMGRDKKVRWLYAEIIPTRLRGACPFSRCSVVIDLLL